MRLANVFIGLSAPRHHPPQLHLTPTRQRVACALKPESTILHHYCHQGLFEWFFPIAPFVDVPILEFSFCIDVVLFVVLCFFFLFFVLLCLFLLFVGLSLPVPWWYYLVVETFACILNLLLLHDRSYSEFDSASSSSTSP